MQTRTSLTLTGHLGREVELRLTTPREFRRTVHDPVIDGEVVYEGTTPVREYAALSLAVHQGTGRQRSTRWYQLRAFNLDDHPDERRIRTARKGQRIEITGHPEVYRYTDSQTGEEREFHYIAVHSFRWRPGRLLRQGERSQAA